MFENTLRIGETQHGLDFFYGRPQVITIVDIEIITLKYLIQDSRKLLEFLQHVSPVKYKTAQKLIGHDVNNATYNYKQETFSIARFKDAIIMDLHVENMKDLSRGTANSL